MLRLRQLLLLLFVGSVEAQLASIPTTWQVMSCSLSTKPSLTTYYLEQGQCSNSSLSLRARQGFSNAVANTLGNLVNQSTGLTPGEPPTFLVTCWDLRDLHRLAVKPQSWVPTPIKYHACSPPFQAPIFLRGTSRFKRSSSAAFRPSIRIPMPQRESLHSVFYHRADRHRQGT